MCFVEFFLCRTKTGLVLQKSQNFQAGIYLKITQITQKITQKRLKVTPHDRILQVVCMRKEVNLSFWE